VTGGGLRALACASLLFCALGIRSTVRAATAALAGMAHPASKDEPPTVAQHDDAPPDWAPRVSGYLYLTPDGDYLQPTFAADHEWLHMEVRYNYEDRSTVSTWMGYNFSAGKKITLEITPMYGTVIGDTDGMALGYEGTLAWRWLELYSESEYLFALRGRSDSFLYTWTTLTASPADWLRVGAVVQRTQAYETSLDIQRGFLVGLSTEHAGVTAYVINPDLHRPTYVLALDVSW